MQLGQFFEIKQTFFSTITIYRRFFSSEDKGYRARWLWLTLLVIGNIAQASMYVVLNACFSQFFMILGVPGLTYHSFFWPCIEFLAASTVASAIAVGNTFIANRLLNYINTAMLKHYIKEWFSSRLYLSDSLLPQAESQGAVNFPHVLSEHIKSNNYLATKLTQSFLNAFFSFGVGIYGLWQLSMPLSIELASMSITVPGYLLIVAVLYGVSYHFATRKVTEKIRLLKEEEGKNNDELAKKLYEVKQNGLEIALLNGSKTERDVLFKNIDHSNECIANREIWEYGLAFFTSINERLRVFAGIMLSAPQILKKKISVDNIFIIGEYFSFVANFFAWHKDNQESINRMSILTQKIKEVTQQIDQAKNMYAENHKIETKEEKSFRIDELLLQIPERGSNTLHTIIEQHEPIELKGKRTWLRGKSGKGKSTLFNLLRGIWPYAEGQISTPVKQDEIVFISQKTYLPARASLYEVILYPKWHPELQNKSIPQESITKIQQLLKKFGLSELISKAGEQADWGRCLSGGQRSKIALIRGIMSDPSYLCMDEPFAGLGEERKICEELLLGHMSSETRILCIEHASPAMPDFFDEVVELKDKKLTATVC